MTDLMKLRIRGNGPEAWRFRIEDAETGKLLPVMAFTLDVHDNVMTINATLMVSEVDIEGIISIPDLIRQVAVEGETVDQWVGKTVSLVLDGAD